MATLAIDASAVVRFVTRDRTDESGLSTQHRDETGTSPAAPPPGLPVEAAATRALDAGEVAHLIGRHQAEAPRPRRQLVPALALHVCRDDGRRPHIDRPTFTALLDPGNWSLVTEFLVTGRWYQEGLDLALRLLTCADRYRRTLSARDEATARITLYALVLDMLDRLDAWDAYVAVWQQLRQRTAYSIQCGDHVATDPRAQRYILGREGDRFQLHFLWYTDHRARLIARKLARHRAGRPVGQLRHHPPSALSERDRRQRLAWVALRGRLRRWPDVEPEPPTPRRPLMSLPLPAE